MKQLITILLCLVTYSEVFSQQPIFASDGLLLYSFNLNNCTSRLVGSMNSGFGDIAFTPDGNLWGISEGSIYKIDTVSANCILIGNTSIGGVSLVALNDSVLLSEYKDSLWGININSLKTYNIGNIGYSAAGDLTWYDNDLYMTTGSQLIKIVLNSANTAILSSAPVNSVIDPIPIDCEGIVTASFPGLENSIVGWSNANENAYKICPIDGSFQLLCPLAGQYAGAASIRLPTQNPLPTSCEDILPIDLLNFSYSVFNKIVYLQWQTAREINSDYFLIQRSIDGVNFRTIGKQTAADNSSSLKQYLFTDTHCLNINYYRLQEIDLNRNATYSDILLVQLPNLSELSIIQNPIQNILQLQINTNQSQLNHLSIIDLLGRRIENFNVKDGFQTFDISHLQQGVYTLQMISGNGQIYNERFVKQN